MSCLPLLLSLLRPSCSKMFVRLVSLPADLLVVLAGSGCGVVAEAKALPPHESRSTYLLGQSSVVVLAVLKKVRSKAIQAPRYVVR